MRKLIAVGEALAAIAVMVCGCADDVQMRQFPSRFERLSRINTTYSLPTHLNMLPTTAEIWAGKCIAQESPSLIWGAALSVSGTDKTITLVGDKTLPQDYYLKTKKNEISDDIKARITGIRTDASSKELALSVPLAEAKSVQALTGKSKRAKQDLDIQVTSGKTVSGGKVIFVSVSCPGNSEKCNTGDLRTVPGGTSLLQCYLSVNKSLDADSAEGLVAEDDISFILNLE